MEPINPKTGMTHTESREFIRNHFEEFVNRKNVDIGNVNFAPSFVDHGAAQIPDGSAGGIQERDSNLQVAESGNPVQQPPS